MSTEEQTALDALLNETREVRARLGLQDKGIIAPTRLKRLRRRKFTPGERERILRRTAGLCNYCRAILTVENMTVDHYNPLARGGTHELDNLVAACEPCNVSKGDKAPHRPPIIACCVITKQLPPPKLLPRNPQPEDYPVIYLEQKSSAPETAEDFRRLFATQFTRKQKTRATHGQAA